MRDYDVEVLQALDPSVQLVFARDDPQVRQAPKCSVFQYNGVAAFSVYPRTDREVELNELLWRIVQESSFRSAELAPFLVRKRKSSDACRGVALALGIPAKLIQFLEAVTLDEMHSSVIHMLADAAQGEDEEGLQLMRDELSPAVWARLEPVLLQDSTCCDPKDSGETIARRSPEGSKDLTCNKFASGMLDMALQSSHAQNYWTVEIQGTFLEPSADGKSDSNRKFIGPTAYSNDRAAVIHNLYLD
jgi:hypothetical protein